MLKDKLNICNIYILFWYIYSLQKVLNISGIIPQVLLVVNLMISLYGMWEVLRQPRVNSYFRALTVLLGMFTIYGVALILSGERITFASMNAITNSGYLKSIAISLLPIYPFYFFAQRGLLTERMLKRWIGPLLFLAIAVFLYNRNMARMIAVVAGSDEVEFTNNAGYLFVSLLPIISFFRRKPIMQYSLLAFCMAFILAAMKRGAILIGFIFAIIMIKDTMSKNRNMSRINVVMLSLILIAVLYFSIDYYLNSSEYFNQRIDETLSGNSSGRDRLYSKFWDHFLHHNTDLQFFFGAGASSTVSIAGNYAHNDWLEILINQGLFGGFVYLYYWIVVFKTWQRYDKSQPYTLAFGIALGTSFLQTLFSMSYNNMEFYTAMVIGYCLASNEGFVDDEDIESEEEYTIGTI